MFEVKFGCDKTARLKSTCKRSVEGAKDGVDSCNYCFYSRLSRIVGCARQIGRIECAEISTVNACKRQIDHRV